MPRDPNHESAGRLVLGLGNPGDRYRDTRHNLGFRVIDALAERSGAGSWRLECNTLLFSAPDTILGKPQTYMNRSGHAARCLVERMAFRPEEILVVFDDVHLPLGRVRLRPSGGPGGHRGMESILGNLRTDAIPRLRLGVGDTEGGQGPEELVEFVLSPFRRDEEAAIGQMIEKSADAVGIWLTEGIAEAMNRING